MALSKPFIPEFITVHLGAPDKKAKNVKVSFPDYIKNVASGEIYPTWPESALRANIYAQVTYALNRVYTEFYRSKGYDFDITSSTQYDQTYAEGREIFQNISKITDDIFNDYVVKQGQIQPYFTQYCAGTCPGLSQWGTVGLAKKGYTPYEILQNYYGDDINIVKNAPVKTNIPSYPGVLFRLGSAGEEVRKIQLQLNRISRNYPSIPKIQVVNGIFEASTYAAVKKFQSIFNLSSDGIVGKDTWYKLKYIYNGVKGLSELYSEGISITEAEREYSELLRRGSRGTEVRVLQYYLAFLAYFNPKLPTVAVDGIFGSDTYKAVTAFQSLYGLTVDGLVGRGTWNRIQDAYNGTVNSLPPQYRKYSIYFYPGYVITTGAKGEAVVRLQRFLRAIGENNKNVPIITVDGIYGPSTAAAVRAVQRINGLEETGQVGVPTWEAIIKMYLDI